MRSLADYLDLTVEQARSQWGQILRRQAKPRQEPYTPVEAILCYGLFFVMDPHRYGGGSMHRAPEILHDLARLFVRPPGSLNNKMMNLDGSRANAAAHEWTFFTEMAADPSQFLLLYNTTLLGARDMGIGVNRLPDFLSLDGVTNFDLFGQDELSQRTLETVLEVRAAKKRGRSLAGDEMTSRLVEHEIRIGQHRLSKSVLDNFAHTCGFCGFEPRSIPRNKLPFATGPSAPRCHRPKSPAQGPFRSPQGPTSWPLGPGLAQVLDACGVPHCDGRRRSVVLLTIGFGHVNLRQHAYPPTSALSGFRRRLASAIRQHQTTTSGSQTGNCRSHGFGTFCL